MMAVSSKGRVNGGTVVLGTVTGPPPPTEPAEPDDFETGLPGPLREMQQDFEGAGVRRRDEAADARVGDVPLREGDRDVGQHVDPDPMRSAVTGKLTDFVTPCMSRSPTAL